MEARDLWLMEKAAFNAWRQANDLPGLLSFFRQSLPHFSEWLNQYGITDAEFLGLDHTSHFFLGDGPMYLTDATEPAEPGAATRGRGLFVADVPADQLVARVPPGHLFNIRSSKRFLPYWHWLKTQRHVHLFRIPRAGNNAVTDDLVYMSWRSVPRLREPGAGGHAFDSTAYLFYDHEVLKMG